MEEKKIIDSISHTEIKNVLVKHGIEWRNSKTVLGKSRDAEYELKKNRIEELRYNTPPHSVLLYQDEKGPIAAKTYGGTLWCSTQAKIEKAQKIKGILNTFGVYDYTNDQMYTHCYRNKTSEQFIDFIKRVDSKYNSNIKTIFVVLDNAPIHRSKKTRNAIVRNYPRIVLVFQPTRSPELNLIEVRWMWLQRKAINNSTFRNESDIGKAVSDWTCQYNNTHSNITRDSLHNELMYLFT